MAAPTSAGPAHAQDSAPAQETSYPNPNVQGNPYIYLAVYSSVPVYEMMVRGIGVMRRRADSFLNATQILKVAGVEKGKRTKILEKDIAQGPHEKVQGGYGRYQGTWIPYERAVELAHEYSVYQLLVPIFEYQAPPAPTTISGTAATAPSPSARRVTAAADSAASTSAGAAAVPKRGRDSLASNGSVEESGKRPRLDSSPTVTVFPLAARPPVDHPSAWKLRRSTKASAGSIEGWNADPVRLERHKSVLKEVFSEPLIGAPTLGMEVDGPVPNLALTFPAEMDPDTPMDDNEHTALHWAAALGRVGVVRALANVNADLARGNNVGETALIRAVLVTNNSDQDSFGALLAILGPTLRTVDDTGRTVLHHAALVAGVKGRATSARYYMQSILEYVANAEHGLFKDLVDAQDKHGDTALCIAARVGNRALVRMLLDVGADKARANKLGLKPADFGVEGIDLSVTAAEEAVAAVRSPVESPPAPVADILAALGKMLDGLQAEHAQELAPGLITLDNIRQEIHDATRELAAQRTALSNARTLVAKKAALEARCANLEAALALEDSFDWTGRTEIDGTPAAAEAGVGFTYRGAESTLSAVQAGEMQFAVDPELPQEERGAGLVQLQRLELWYGRVLGLLRERCEALRGGDAEQEERLRRVVASACEVEPAEVEGMLDGLVIALESDGSQLELPRVASFLSRAKDGVFA